MLVMAQLGLKARLGPRECGDLEAQLAMELLQEVHGSSKSSSSRGCSLSTQHLILTSELQLQVRVCHAVITSHEMSFQEWLPVGPASHSAIQLGRWINKRDEHTVEHMVVG